jgi:Fur family ferric uptake transcriptional regulator
MTDLESKCIRSGLKMTDQRRVILRVLATAEDHPSVETVYRRAKDIDRTISMATVYRTLNLLDELNLVQKHDFKEAKEEHHHHLVDVESGEVIEFTNEPLEILKHEIASELGFDLVDHTLELYGRKKRN